MDNVTEQFMTALGNIAEGTQHPIVEMCSYALGLNYGPCHVVEFDAVGRRLADLIERERVSEAVLISGLLQFLIDYLESSANLAEQVLATDFDEVRENIERGMAAFPEIWKKAGDVSFVDDIRNPSDEMIASTLADVHSLRNAASAIREIRQEKFGQEFWHQWARERRPLDL